MKSTLFFGLLAITVLGIGCFGAGNDRDQSSSGSPSIDTDAILLEARAIGLIMNEVEVSAMAALVPLEDAARQVPGTLERSLEIDVRAWPSAALADVTGGGSFGIAHASFESGTFTLIAEMGNLPEPAQEYFYEGWLVRRGDALSVVSLGRAVRTQDGYASVYESGADWSDYDFFVLTLEADDGNPSPGEHILEGAIK